MELVIYSEQHPDQQAINPTNPDRNILICGHLDTTLNKQGTPLFKVQTNGHITHCHTSHMHTDVWKEYGHEPHWGTF